MGKEGGVTIAAQLLQSAKTGGTDVHFTPAVVLDRVRMIAPIALDPCTEEDNPCGAVRFFTKKHDALAFTWQPVGLVFANPPYSDMARWAEKIAAEAAAWPVPFIVLCAARPDTRWWRTMLTVADVFAFWRGRITFGGQTSAAPFPSALFGLNVSHRRFRQAFSEVADVVIPC